MFYHYSQNNSGGDFVVNGSVAHQVIIEAKTADEANRIAETIGLYFDGRGDCPCCGNRWYEAYGEGDGTPLIYGIEPQDYYSSWVNSNEVYCYVYYLNGVVEDHRWPDDPAEIQRRRDLKRARWDDLRNQIDNKTVDAKLQLSNNATEDDDNV